MRNIDQHPITVDEIVQALESIPTTNAIGPVQNHVRAGIINYFKDGQRMAELLMSYRQPQRCTHTWGDMGCRCALRYRHDGECHCFSFGHDHKGPVPPR